MVSSNSDVLLLSGLLHSFGDKKFWCCLDCCVSAVRVIISTLGSVISTLGGGAGGFAKALGSQL